MRSNLPNRRSAETFAFHHDKIDYVVTVGRNDDGSIAEVFVNGGKLDSGTDVMIRDAAIAASLALQYGCPPSVLAGALTRVNDETPAGPLGMLLQMLLGDRQ